MMDGCPERRPDLGAYVVGALESAERAEFEAHLPECRGCRNELASLAGLPGMLARLSPEEVEPGSPPPEHLAAGLVGALAQRRRGRRGRITLMAAGCALVLAIGGAILATRTSSGPVPGSTVVSTLDTGTHVRARLALASAPWGTEVALRMSDVAPGTRCRLVAVATDGRREVAATWRADYEGKATIRGATAIPVADLDRVLVVADRRGPLVNVRV
jgi:predicted anti-sigma-YlaC factor YlaD